MALIFALVGCAWLLYYYLPGNDFTYFWGFFAMAVILLLLGALAGLIAARAVKRARRPCPTWRSRRPARSARRVVPPSGDAARQPRGPHELMGASADGRQRSPAEIRNSIESNRMELAVSVDRLRGEVAHITDWRGHVERHRASSPPARRWSAVVGRALLRRRRRRERSAA